MTSVFHFVFTFEFKTLDILNMIQDISSALYIFSADQISQPWCQRFGKRTKNEMSPLRIELRTSAACIQHVKAAS